MAESTKAILVRGFKKWAEDQALDFRSKLSLRPFEPLCAFDLVRYFDIDLLCPHKVTGLTEADLKVLSKTSKGCWSAVTIRKPVGGFLIIYNNAHAPTRTQSDLMHEMAHVICAHESSSVETHPELGVPLRKHDERQEGEAEWLGSCLQLPREALVWAIQQGMNIKAMSSYYNASEQMVRYRINVTGLKKLLQLSIN